MVSHRFFWTSKAQRAANLLSRPWNLVNMSSFTKDISTPKPWEATGREREQRSKADPEAWRLTGLANTLTNGSWFIYGKEPKITCHGQTAIGTAMVELMWKLIKLAEATYTPSCLKFWVNIRNYKLKARYWKSWKQVPMDGFRCNKIPALSITSWNHEVGSFWKQFVSDRSESSWPYWPCVIKLLCVMHHK